MAAISIYPAEQIGILSAGDSLDHDRMAVDFIVLHGTAAGSFVFTLGNVTLTINNTATALSVVVPVHRSLNTIGLTSGPTAAKLYVFLEQKR